MFTEILFFISPYFTITYKMSTSEKLTFILLKGCRLVVGAPRKLMWTNWTIQSGQSLTSRPEQNFAHMEVTKYVKPKGRRIIGHNESEGMKLRDREQLHRAKVSTSLKPVSLHPLIGECVGDVPECKRRVIVKSWKPELKSTSN